LSSPRRFSNGWPNEPRRRIHDNCSEELLDTGHRTGHAADREPQGRLVSQGDRGRRSWEIEGPVLLGHIVHHIVLDPRDQGTLLMAARTGHLGPTVFRSTDNGKTW
jgi:hypothetical protein